MDELAGPPGVVYLLFGIGLWVLVGFRWRQFLAPGPGRAMAVALTFMGGFAVLSNSRVQLGLEGALGSAVAAVAVKNACVYFMAVSVIWLSRTLRNPTSRWSPVSTVKAAAATAGAVVMIEPVFTGSPAVELTPIISEVYDPLWGNIVYWMLLAGTPALACLFGAHVVLVSTRQAVGTLRVGMFLVSIGNTIGFLFTTYKLVQFIVLAMGGSAFTGFTTHFVLFPGAVVLFVLIGCAFDPVCALFERLVDHRRARRLELLWRVLHPARTEIAPRSRITDSAELGLEDSRLVLLRRVIEIRDGILGLQQYMTPQVEAAAAALLDQVSGAGNNAWQDPAAHEAVRLIAAEHERQSGGKPTAPLSSRSPHEGVGAADLVSEVRWLQQVAAWHRQLQHLTRSALQGAGAGANTAPKQAAAVRSRSLQRADAPGARGPA